MSRLRTELTKPRLSVLTACTLAYELFYASQAQSPGQNSWNVIVPALTNASFAVTVGLLWWTLVLIEIGRDVVSPEALVRIGSRAHAVLYVLKRAMPQLALGFAVVAVVSLAVAAVTRPSAWWSDATLHAANTGLGEASAYSSVGLAGHFQSPVAAIALFGCYTGLAFLALAAIYASTLMTVRASVASGGLLVLYLWGACCSFGAASAAPWLDAVTLFDLSWALHVRAAVPIAVMWVVAGISATALLRVRDFSASLRSSFARGSALLAVPVAAFVFSLGSPTAAFAGRWQYLYLGRDGTLFDYSRIGVCIYLLASVPIVQYIESATSTFIPAALRYGSRWRWTVPFLSRGALVAALGVALQLIGSLCAVAFSGVLPSQPDLALILRTGLGLLVSTWLIEALGLLVVSIASTPQAWVLVVAVTIFTGYSTFVPLGTFDVFSLYSPSFTLAPLTLVGGVATALVLTALSVVGLRFSAGRNRYVRQTLDEIAIG